MLFNFEMEKSTPYAPKELEGEYKLVINGRKMQLTKLPDCIKSHTTCNKADGWNMVDGINVCLERMKNKLNSEIGVGDKVEIINSDRVYPLYVDWVTKNISKSVEIARFVNHSVSSGYLNGKCGIVLAVAPHSDNDKTMLTYVQIYVDEHYENYVINTKGLRKIKE